MRVSAALISANSPSWCLARESRSARPSASSRRKLAASSRNLAAVACSVSRAVCVRRNSVTAWSSRVRSAPRACNSVRVASRCSRQVLRSRSLPSTPTSTAPNPPAVNPKASQSATCQRRCQAGGAPAGGTGAEGSELGEDTLDAGIHILPEFVDPEAHDLPAERP